MSKTFAELEKNRLRDFLNYWCTTIIDKLKDGNFVDFINNEKDQQIILKSNRSIGTYDLTDLPYPDWLKATYNLSLDALTTDILKLSDMSNSTVIAQIDCIKRALKTYCEKILTFLAYITTDNLKYYDYKIEITNNVNNKSVIIPFPDWLADRYCFNVPLIQRGYSLKIIELKDLIADEDKLSIKWRITRACNYKCSYCLQAKKRVTEISDSEALAKIAEDIEKLIQRAGFKTAELEVIGGEVSTISQLPYILSLIPSAANISITTNLSRDADWYNALPDNMSITASFHDEYVSVSEFLDKFEQLRFSNKQVETVENDRTESIVKDFISECEKRNITYRVDTDRLQKIARQNKSSRVSDRLQVICDNGESFFFKNKFELFNERDGLFEESVDTRNCKVRTKGYTCTAGYNYIVIDEQGKIGTGVKCLAGVPITEWIPQKRKCPEPTCSLCGRINLKL